MLKQIVEVLASLWCDCGPRRGKALWAWVFLMPGELASSAVQHGDRGAQPVPVVDDARP